MYLLCRWANFEPFVLVFPRESRLCLPVNVFPRSVSGTKFLQNFNLIKLGGVVTLCFRRQGLARQDWLALWVVTSRIRGTVNKQFGRQDVSYLGGGGRIFFKQSNSLSGLLWAICFLNSSIHPSITIVICEHAINIELTNALVSCPNLQLVAWGMTWI